MEGLFSVVGKTFEPWCFRPDESPVIPLFDHGDSMSKVASSLDHVPAIQNYINRARPEKGWYTLLIHANGTDEVWGPNKKGDSFPLADLVPMAKSADYGFKTFESMANGYVHHRNTPDKWTGRVVLAEFNEPMGRVELIARFNIQRLIEEGAPYFVDMLNTGKLPAVSMGCRVPYDECSVCGNKAPTVAQYCECLRFRRLATLPDGRRVRMWNRRPKFHDISLVGSPADPAARVLLKVAEEYDQKLSEISKRIPAQTVGGVRRLSRDEYAVSLSTQADPDLALPTLLAAARQSKHASYSALTAMGIILRPHEFAAVELARAGHLSKAAEVYNARPSFAVYDHAAPHFTWVPPEGDVLGAAEKDIPHRSVYMPVYERRLSNFKYASDPVHNNDVPVPDSVQAAYSGYRKHAEARLLDGTASNWAYHQPKILTHILASDIPLLLKFASLDEPKDTFGKVLRGAYL